LHRKIDVQMSSGIAAGGACKAIWHLLTDRSVDIFVERKRAASECAHGSNKLRIYSAPAALGAICCAFQQADAIKVAFAHFLLLAGACGYGSIKIMRK
jgi:ribosomal protein L37E